MAFPYVSFIQIAFDYLKSGFYLPLFEDERENLSLSSGPSPSYFSTMKLRKMGFSGLETQLVLFREDVAVLP